MTPGTYIIPYSALRNSWYFTYYDAGTNEATNYGSIVVHEDNLVTFNLSLRRTAVCAAGTLMAVLDIFKSQVIPPGADPNAIAHWTIGNPLYDAGTGVSPPYVDARLDYNGNLYISRPSVANTAYLFYSTVMLANG